MRIRVEVKNEILGDSIFWEGDSSNVELISNIVARGLAKRVAKEGGTKKSGMWYVSEIS